MTWRTAKTCQRDHQDAVRQVKITDMNGVEKIRHLVLLGLKSE